MKLKLHHINFCSTNVRHWMIYRDVLDLDPDPASAGGRVTSQGYAGNAAFY